MKIGDVVEFAQRPAELFLVLGEAGGLVRALPLHGEMARSGTRLIAVSKTLRHKVICGI